MVIGVIVLIFGAGALVLGVLQLLGVLPRAMHRAAVPVVGVLATSTNLTAGVFLIALGVLRLRGVL